jgi:hypothetical protein
MKLIVKCVSRRCGAKKDASEHRGPDPPLCDRCGLPMVPVKASR